MARKRYETAFIPSATTQPSSQYPDVDSLLLSIDGLGLCPGDLERRRRPSQRYLTSGSHRWRSKSLTPFEHHRVTIAPSISTCPVADTTTPHRRQPRPPSIDSVSWNSDKEQQGSPQNIRNYRHETIDSTGHSKRLDCRGQPTIPRSLPASEPLRPKHFLIKSYSSIQSSSGCSTTNSSSPIPKLQKKGQRSTITLQPKPCVQSLVKVSSVSSLDSIDSGRSEDPKFERGVETKLPPISKLLSPISDKSPIEAVVTVPDVKPNLDKITMTEHSVILSTAEQLTNLPWEMPKLKRKLALLVDSGISLDMGGESWPCSSDSKGQPKRPWQLDPPNEMVNDWNSNQGKMEEISDSPPTTEVPPIPLTEPLPPRGISKPDRCKMKLDFGDGSSWRAIQSEHINVNVCLEEQDWFHGVITRIEAEEILRVTKPGSFLVRHCESSVFNRYSLSLKSSRGFIHIRIQPKFDSGKFALSADAIDFDSIPSLVLHYLSNRLPIKGAEHVLLKYPVIASLL